MTKCLQKKCTLKNIQSLNNMSKLYTRVPVAKFPKSTFSQSRPVVGSMSAQRLYCTNAKEVLPSDDWRASSEAFVRLQPLVAPVLAKLSVHQEAFFVPCWQLNDHFEEFITRGERGTYNEKMPYIHVSTLYDLIKYLLDNWSQDMLSLFGFTIEDKVLDLYHFIVDKVVRIIELSDWFRSVPFVLPEFPFKPSLLYDESIDSTISDWLADGFDLDSIFSDALDSFEELNSHLDGSSLIINLLPYFAFLKVYCEYYRDENLVEDWWDSEGNWKDISFKWTGDVSFEEIFDFSSLDEHGMKLLFSLFCVKNRAWSKDRYTSALPFVQKGPDVILPLSGTAPVDFASAGAISDSLHDVHASGHPSQSKNVHLSWTDSVYGEQRISALANFNEASLATTIRDFRTANKLEEFYEADGIGGSRYPENTLVQWGERTPDARLPRAQFLGSFSQPVSVAEVVQNSSTDSTSPQGNLAGKGTSYGRGFLFGKHFSMHGFLLFFTSVKTGAIYEQGINPMFSRFDWTEYAWPRFAHLGEEPIYEKELGVSSSVQEDSVFGYAPRYSSYKSDQGSIHGQLKSTLNYWTMSRRFSDVPKLNEEFIYGDPRRDSWAVTNPFAEQFIVEIDYNIKSRRKLPFFGVPSL